MAFSSANSVAFSMPGGEMCVPSRARPVDLVHLARQTMGDRALEQEVLSMFVQQAGNVRDQIMRADLTQRLFLVHSLIGSARGVGAFHVARIAEELETDPSSTSVLKRLAGAIDEVRDFIAAICR
jgi:HPt (histidine-containing phosphotransfer) domain-containing protein